MSWKTISVLAFLAAAACLTWLAFQGSILATGPLAVAIQIAAGLLIVWARLTFGLRSFHAAADPTAGDLVTRGPYHYLRHPIYASVLYALWAGVAAHWSPLHFLVAALATALLGVRMFAEEQLLLHVYPEYAEYARHTSRVFPSLF